MYIFLFFISLHMNIPNDLMHDNIYVNLRLELTKKYYSYDLNDKY